MRFWPLGRKKEREEEVDNLIYHLSPVIRTRLEEYIALAKEADTPLLPIALEVKEKLPALAIRHSEVEYLYYHGSVSTVKKDVYAQELVKIRAEVAEMIKILVTESDRIEEAHRSKLAHDAELDLARAVDASLTDEIERAKAAIESVQEIEEMRLGS